MKREWWQNVYRGQDGVYWHGTQNFSCVEANERASRMAAFYRLAYRIHVRLK